MLDICWAVIERPSKCTMKRRKLGSKTGYLFPRRDLCLLTGGLQELWHNKGLCYTHLKNYEKAVECFKRANSVQKHDSTYVQLGRVCVYCVRDLLSLNCVAHVAASAEMIVCCFPDALVFGVLFSCVIK